MKKDSIKKIGAIALALVLSTSAVFITSCSDDDDKRIEEKDDDDDDDDKKDKDKDRETGKDSAGDTTYIPNAETAIAETKPATDAVTDAKDDEVIDNSSFTSDEIAQGWSLKNGTLTIINDSAMKDYSDGNYAPWYGERKNINEVVIKNGVTKISSCAFYNCYTLTQITIPDGVTSIGVGAFHNCSSLAQITIPNGVTSIGNYAFSDCYDLTQITIPNGVTSIGDSAFSYCYDLKQITIPNSVTSIGEGAFSDCDSLTQITIPDSVTSIGEYAFSNCSKLQAINVSSGNASYTGVDGVLFNKNKTTLVAYPAGKETVYTIPDGVTSIGVGAFSYCKSLTQITIPDSVTSIGNSAFSYCLKLQTINFTGSEEQWNKITKGSNWDSCVGEDVGGYTVKFGA